MAHDNLFFSPLHRGTFVHASASHPVSFQQRWIHSIVFQLLHSMTDIPPMCHTVIAILLPSIFVTTSFEDLLIELE